MKFFLTPLFFLSLLLLQAQPTSKDWQDSGEIPFELIRNKIILKVQIKGKLYRFLLDTGGILMISKKLQQQYNFERTDRTTISDINRKETTLETVFLPEIGIGNWTFKNRKAIVDPFSNAYPDQCFELDGMIGRDFFDQVILDFDWSRKVLRLTQNAADLELDAQYRTPLRLSHRGIPEALLRIDGKERYIEFDSGSGDLFSYQTKKAKKVRRKNKQEKLCFKGIFSFGMDRSQLKSTERYKIKIDDFEIAGTHFRYIYSDFSKPTAPRIGADLLNYGRLTIDYKNGWLYYKPFGDQQPPSHLSTFGFDIALIDQTYIVKWILKGSAAEQAGLSYGDEVLSMNGLSIESIGKGCEGYLHGYAFEAFDHLSMEVIGRNGQKRKVELAKQSY